VLSLKPLSLCGFIFIDIDQRNLKKEVGEGPNVFIFDSYACRKGKGVHQAVSRYQHWARRYCYVLKLDIQQYFPSIDHALLKAKLRDRIKDKNVLALLDLIIDGSPAPPNPPVYFPGDDLLTPLERRCGIPIGNLTSQFFANLYLDDFDHWVKHTLKAKAYLRYVDDTVLLNNDKQRLQDWREAIREKLAQDRLLLHPRKAHIYRTRDSLNLLGYLMYRDYRRLRSDNGYRFRRRLRGFAGAYRKGYLEWCDFDPSVQAWIGHACHADTRGLRQNIFSGVNFFRGTGQRYPPGYSGRLVEQQPAEGAFR